MIVDEKVYDVQTNVEDAMEFEIALTSKAFQQLSSNLYSKPYIAVVRELGTNAVDSLISAGKPNEKFLVHLPNKWEPFLEVVDKGLGMPEPQIRSLYRRFFDSNKIQTNDLTGMLGLGSKSPLAVTDQFSIQSRYNGTEYLYQIFINHRGIPALSKVYEKPTTEQNGFAVKFAVKEEDFDKFCEAAIEAYSVFQNPPEVVGNSNYRLKAKPEYFVETQDYAVYKEHKGNSRVIMGNVEYPISAWDAVGYNYKDLLSHGIVIYAPIGSVNFTPSRESLHYDEKTKKFIHERIEFIMEDMNKQAEDKLRDCKTRWEARKTIYAISKMGFVDLEPIFNGEKITQHISISKIQEKYQPNVPALESFNVKEYELTYKRRGTGDKLRSTDKASLSPATTVDNFYVVDISEASVKNRVKLYLETEKSSGKGDAKVIVFYNPPEQFIQDEGLEVNKLSTLPKPSVTRKPGIYTRAEKSFMYYWVLYHGYHSKAAANNWKEEEVDLNEGGVYVEIDRFHYVNKNGANGCDPINLNQYDTILKGIVSSDFKIYGIRTADLPKLLKKTRNNLKPWTKLWDYLPKLVKRYEHWKEEIAAHKELDNWSFSYREFWRAMKRIAPNHPKVEEIITFLNKYELLEEKKQCYVNLCNNQGISLEPSETIGPIVEEFFETYPLLKAFAITSYSGIEKYSDGVVKYLDMVDENLGSSMLRYVG